MCTTTMKNNLLHHNIKIIKRNNPILYKHLSSRKTSKDDKIKEISIVNTKRGDPTIEIKLNNSRITLHSKIDPMIEIDRIISLKLSGAEDIIILIGFGLGYLAEMVIKKNPEARILIFEPSLKILNTALEVRDLSNVLNHKKLKIIVGNTAIDDSTFDYLTFYNPVLLHLRSYKTAFPDFTKSIINSYNGYIQKNSINIATLKRFDRLWTKNSFKNAVHFFTKPGIDLLKNVLKGKIGALVVGAGPSIKNQISSIIKIKDRFLTVAVDTALKPLITWGIVPDFVVSVDPQFINSLSLNPSFYKTIKDDKMPILIVDPAVYQTTIRNYPGKIMLCSSLFPPGKIIEHYSGIKGKIAAGGSVAVTAFDFARILGADPIVIIGLDLSYKNGQSHAKGSFVDFYRTLAQNRINTYQTQFVKYLNGGFPIKTINNKKEICYTDKRMLLYKSWFERNIPLSSSSIINATDCGLNLENVKSSKLNSVKSKFLPTLNKKIIMENIISTINSGKSLLENLPDFLGYLKKAESNIEKMLNLSREAKTILPKMKNSDKLAIYNKKLLDIERKILLFTDEVRLISMAMQDVVVNIMQGSNRKDKGSIIDESEMLYSSIENSCIFLLKTIKNTSEKLNFLFSESDN